MIIGNKTFISGTHIMAIVNLTPDSFNENSRCDISNVLNKVETMINDGAEIIDLGAQSTRPGHITISYEEEISRLIEPLKLIKTHFNIPISVDTYYPQVANVALDNGADLINDIWGLQYVDKSMASVIAKYNASTCIMHNQNTTDYKDLFEDIKSFLKESLILAKKAGIQDDKVCLDGGIGFGKDINQNWELLRNYDKLNTLGYPLLLGTSRKRMFGGEVKDRLNGTLESTRIACQKGILFVRVHDVKENAKVIEEEYAKLNRN